MLKFELRNDHMLCIVNGISCYSIRSYPISSVGIDPCFPNIHLRPNHEVDVSGTYLLSVVLSNNENVYNPCKELFSLELLQHIAYLALQKESVCLYLSMLSCLVSSLEIFEISNPKSAEPTQSQRLGSNRGVKVGLLLQYC